MVGKEVSEQVLRALDRRVRQGVFGTTARLNRALGAGKNWWRQRVDSGEISAGQMVLVLEHLGLDPGRFLRELRGTPKHLTLERPRGKPPKIVHLARERLAAGTPGDMGRGYLEELDRLRYRHPQEAVTRATEVVGHVELDLLPLLLGVAGSAYRLWDMRLDEAQHAIEAGIEMARLQENHPAEGDLLQRLAYVLGDHAAYPEALRIAEQATLHHVLCQDLNAVGCTLVDQGLFLFYLGRYESSIERNQSALWYLPEESQRHRFSALQVLGLNFEKLGQLEQASEFAARAAAILKDLDLGPSPKAKLHWLQAEICTQRGDFQGAEIYLQEIISIFSELHAGETALATSELVRVQLLAGKRKTAYETSRTMYPLVEPLHKNTIVSAALADLLRGGETGLTLEVVKQTIEKIETARERHDWRSLWTYN